MAIHLGTAGVVLGPALGEAAAQTDAGQPSGNRNARALGVAPTRSAALQKTMAPSHLPESVQRRLRERAGANPSAEPPVPLPAEAAAAVSETARRIGEARMRRVEAFDTGKGVTILSNRFSESPSSIRVASQPREPIPPREGESIVDPPALTETRSLRAAATSAPTRGNVDHRGWLWPLAALLTVSAGLGTLLYRKIRP